MLVDCEQCDAIIHNDCVHCPWCHTAREPLPVVRRKKQVSLMGLMILVSVLGVWLGLTLQGSMD